MARQQDLNGAGGAFNIEFRDSVFEPSSDFNFEEKPHHMISQDYAHRADFSL